MDKELERRRRPLAVKANMLWNSFGSLVNLACTWAMTVVVLRLSHGFDAAGQFAYIMSIYATFSSVVEYRIYVYQIGDLHQRRSVGEYFALRCITSAAGLILVMVYTVIVSDPTLWLAIFLYSLFKICGTLLEAFHALEQVNHRMDYKGISYALQGIVSLTLFTAVFGTTQSLALSMGAMLVGVIAIGLFYDLPRARLFSEFVPKVCWADARTMLMECTPVMVGMLALSASASVPRQCLMALRGDAALGVYGSIAAPVAIVQSGAAYVYSPLLSYYAEAFDRRNRKRFRSLMALTVFAMLGIGLVCIVVVESLGPFAYGLIYGHEIVQYLYLLVPMVIASLAVAFQGFANDLVAVFRMTGASFWGGVTSLVVALVTMGPLINLFDLNGVSVCNFFAALGASAAMYVPMIRRAHRRFDEPHDAD